MSGVLADALHKAGQQSMHPTKVVDLDALKANLKEGDLFETPNHGLVRFDRWDTFHGQITAEVQLMSGGGRRNIWPKDVFAALTATKVNNVPD